MPNLPRRAHSFPLFGPAGRGLPGGAQQRKEEEEGHAPPEQGPAPNPCQNPRMQFFKDLNLAAFTAGFVAVLVGFTSSVAIVFQAALAFHATPAEIASWMWALGMGMGLCSVIPSLWLKKPVMVAWSTPGAAVLATAGLAGGFSMGEAVAAFMVSAALITLFGITGWFEKLMNRIPVAIASALLAGVLARFGIQAFSAAQTALPLVLLMLAIYLLGKRLLPRYAVVLTLVGAIVFVAARGQLAWSEIAFSFAMQRPQRTEIERRQDEAEADAAQRGPGHQHPQARGQVHREHQGERSGQQRQARAHQEPGRVLVGQAAHAGNRRGQHQPGRQQDGAHVRCRELQPQLQIDRQQVGGAKQGRAVDEGHDAAHGSP